MNVKTIRAIRLLAWAVILIPGFMFLWALIRMAILFGPLSLGQEGGFGWSITVDPTELGISLVVILVAAGVLFLTRRDGHAHR
jgi:hypothetical protein